MSAFFTIATNAQATLADTTRLLFDHAAVWMPPMSIPPCGVIPQPGDLFWLLYDNRNQLQLLGGGPIALAPRVMNPTGHGYTVLWNERDRPGLRTDARTLNYGGPDNMTFFRLDPPKLFGLEHSRPIILPDQRRNGLNLATAGQEAVLQAIFSI